MGVEELAKALETIALENSLSSKQQKEMYDKVWEVIDGCLSEYAL